MVNLEGSCIIKLANSGTLSTIEIHLSLTTPQEIHQEIKALLVDSPCGAPDQAIHLHGIGIASAESFGSLTVRLGDPAESKKLWESPLGQILINLLWPLLIALYVQWCADLSAQQIEAQREEFMKAQEEQREIFMRGLLKQHEEFLHKEGQQLQPTPKNEHREKEWHTFSDLIGGRLGPACTDWKNPDSSPRSLYPLPVQQKRDPGSSLGIARLKLSLRDRL